MRSHKLKDLNFKRAGKNTFCCTPVLLALMVFFSQATAFAGPWSEHMMKISYLSRQVAGLESEIKELIERKRHSQNPEEIKTIVDTIASKHKELQDVAKKHDEEWLHMRFKHPEQSDIVKREYQRYQVKSIHEMESEMGIDAKLDRIKRRALAVFPVPARSEDPRFQLKISPLVRKPAATDAAKIEDPDSFEQIKISR